MKANTIKLALYDNFSISSGENADSRVTVGVDFCPMSNCHSSHHFE